MVTLLRQSTRKSEILETTQRVFLVSSWPLLVTLSQFIIVVLVCSSVIILICKAAFERMRVLIERAPRFDSNRVSLSDASLTFFAVQDVIVMCDVTSSSSKSIYVSFYRVMSALRRRRRRPRSVPLSFSSLYHTHTVCITDTIPSLPSPRSPPSSYSFSA